MGDSVENLFYREFPNTTKCLSWYDVKKSHMEQDQDVVITFENISGLLLVLAVGLIVALMILSLELLVAATKRKSMASCVKSALLVLYPEEK